VAKFLAARGLRIGAPAKFLNPLEIAADSSQQKSYGHSRLISTIQHGNSPMVQLCAGSE